MKSNINQFASKEATQGTVLKTERQMLIDAEKKIGELETIIRTNAELIEKLKWQCAQLRIGITAMGNHYNCSPQQCKELFDAYVAEQEKALKEQGEEAKKQFMEDLKNGKVPELRVVNDSEPIPFDPKAVDNTKKD